MPKDTRQSRYIVKTTLIVLLLAVCLLLARYLALSESTKELPPANEESGNSKQAIQTNTASLFRPLTTPQPPEKPPPTPKKQTQTNPGLQPAKVKQRNNKAQFDSRFVKIAFNGSPLNSDVSYWSCARDLQTGLLWEVKLFNAGVSDAEHTYSWYKPGQDNPGKENGGRCFGTRCDTDAYVQEMNRLELCGSTAWRLPTFPELEGLIDRNYYNPTINQEIFPHGQGAVYWTGTELKNNPIMVMQIDFFNGISNAVPKNLSYSLRLVSP